MYVFGPFEQNKLKNVKKCFCYPFSFQVCSNIEFQHFNIFSCAKRKWALYYLDYFSRGFYFFFTNQEFKFFTWTKFCETRFSVLNIAILENPNCAYKIARRQNSSFLQSYTRFSQLALRNQDTVIKYYLLMILNIKEEEGKKKLQIFLIFARFFLQIRKFFSRKGQHLGIKGFQNFTRTKFRKNRQNFAKINPLKVEKFTLNIHCAKR